jgi:hypothetical protein
MESVGKIEAFSGGARVARQAAFIVKSISKQFEAVFNWS